MGSVEPLIIATPYGAMKKVAAADRQQQFWGKLQPLAVIPGISVKIYGSSCKRVVKRRPGEIAAGSVEGDKREHLQCLLVIRRIEIVEIVDATRQEDIIPAAG